MEGTYRDKNISLDKLQDRFFNNDTSLLATSFLKDGSVAYIPKGSGSVELKSYTLQPLTKFVISDEEAKSMTGFDLALSNGNTVSITFSTSDLGHKVETVSDLADILNSGVTPGGASFNFSSYGLIAGGRDGNLTISSSGEEFTSASVSTKISGTLNAAVFNPTASELISSNMHVFTREGKHVAGVPLTTVEAANLVNEDNGFVIGASYNAEYINGNYRGIDIKRNSIDGDYVLYNQYWNRIQA